MLETASTPATKAAKNLSIKLQALLVDQQPESIYAS